MWRPMSQYLAFISNHPFLAASAAALLGLIVAYELRNATRGYHDVDAADGATSGRVAAQFIRGGCKRVYQLNGGLTAWQSAGLPLAK